MRGLLCEILLEWHFELDDALDVRTTADHRQWDQSADTVDGQPGDRTLLSVVSYLSMRRQISVDLSKMPRPSMKSRYYVGGEEQDVRSGVIKTAGIYGKLSDR